MTVTQIKVAEHLGISRRLVADLVAQGIFTKPLKLEQCRKAYIARLQASAAGRDSKRGRSSGRLAEAASPREIVKEFALSRDLLIPWHSPPDNLVTLPEYGELMGLPEEDGGAFDLLIYGLPLVPPAQGQEVARVSLAHAERYRMLLALFLNGLGGPSLGLDDDLARIAPELNKLRGVG